MQEKLKWHKPELIPVMVAKQEKAALQCEAGSNNAGLCQAGSVTSAGDCSGGGSAGNNCSNVGAVATQDCVAGDSAWACAFGTSGNV